jgi:hypothetical protein
MGQARTRWQEDPGDGDSGPPAQISILGEADLANAQAVLAPAVLAPAVRPARVLPTPRPARAVVRPVSTVAGSPTRAMRGQDSPQPVAKGKLAGSALSIGTWRQAVDAMRERSVRR